MLFTIAVTVVSIYWFVQFVLLFIGAHGDGKMIELIREDCHFKRFDAPNDRIWWKYAKRFFRLVLFLPMQTFPNSIFGKLNLIFKKEEK